MTADLVRLPGGQTVTVCQDLSSIVFEPTSSALSGWRVFVGSQDETLDSSAAPLTPELLSEEGERAAKRQCSLVLHQPTLENDTLYISPMSCPSNATSNVPVPSTRQVAIMLYSSLNWYFQHPPPSKTTNPKTAHTTPFGGKPLGEWRVHIKRQGYLKDQSLIRELERMGLVTSMDSAAGTEDESGWDDMFVAQRMFWQIPAELFAMESETDHRPSFYPPPPLVYTTTNGILHPIRQKPPRMGEVFYTRFVPSVDEYISFRVASTSPQPVPYAGPRGSKPPAHTDLTTLSDTELIKHWMAKPRVKEFWGEYTDDFLPVALKTPNSFPVIGLWDGVPFGFFQIYWVKEDILGQHVGGAVADAFDRGLHVFIGEDWARGRVPQWLSSLAHWCFGADNRTMSVCLEPRVDNARFLKRLEENGFYRERQVTFPHKQSWMVRLRRETWQGPAL